MARFLTFIIALLAFCNLSAQTPASVQLPPKYEVRAVWLTTIGGLDWPSSFASNPQTAERQRRELVQILDQLHRANINTVLLQTRIRSTTIYPSRLEPWDACLTGHPGQSPGYDPLQFAIEQCHLRGMELHAWVVTIPVGKWNAPSVKSLRNKQPNLIKKIGDEAYMNPEDSRTAAYLADICGEIASNYDVDGIHLDYIRYPETWKERLNRVQGRQHITRIVAAISHKVKALKPWVKVSCSPIGKFDDLTRASSRGWNAYTKGCQDAQGWLRDGLMDALFPMMYFRGEQFFPFAIDWQENSYGRIVAPGLGIYFMSPKEKNWPLTDITNEMYVSRSLGMGHTFFRSRFLTDNLKGLYQFTANQFDNYPALIPPMKWLHATPPPAPPTLNVAESATSVTLSWGNTRANSVQEGLRYNVYASSSSPVNTNDARNLMATNLRSTSISFKKTQNTHFYAVTSVDRYGNESLPKQSLERSEPRRYQLIGNDGKRLKVPVQGSALEAERLLICTLGGQIITSCAYRDGQTLDISRLPEGTYMLRTLNKKHVSHRIGHFFVRRQQRQSHP